MDSDAECLMADCNEPQGHFCFTHTVEVFGSRGLATPDAASFDVESCANAISKYLDDCVLNHHARSHDRIAVIICDFLPNPISTDAVRQARRDRPKIICLCGLTRFVQTWIDEYQRLSDEGNIVLTVARMPPRPNLQHEQPELKQKLDGLHFHKIALADEVFILNVGGYIGESTAKEIEHAMSLNKTIRWLERPAAALRAEGTVDANWSLIEQQQWISLESLKVAIVAALHAQREALQAKIEDLENRGYQTAIFPCGCIFKQDGLDNEPRLVSTTAHYHQRREP